MLNYYYLSTPTHLGWERIPGSYLRETPYFGSSRRCWGQWSHCCSCTGRLVLCRRKQEQADTSPLMVCTHLGTWLLGRVGKWEPKDNSSRELPLQQGHSERCVCKTLPCPSQCHKVKAKLFILDLSVTNYCYVPMWTFTQYQLQLAHQKKLSLKKPQKINKPHPSLLSPYSPSDFLAICATLTQRVKIKLCLEQTFQNMSKHTFHGRPSEDADFPWSPQCALTLEKEISEQVINLRLMSVLPSSSLWPRLGRHCIWLPHRPI